MASAEEPLLPTVRTPEGKPPSFATRVYRDQSMRRQRLQPTCMGARGGDMWHGMPQHALHCSQSVRLVGALLPVPLLPDVPGTDSIRLLHPTSALYKSWRVCSGARTPELAPGGGGH